jgi:hypothetical protein
MRVIRHFSFVALFVAVMFAVTFGSILATGGKYIPIPEAALYELGPFTQNGATSECSFVGDNLADLYCEGTAETVGNGEFGVLDFEIDDTMCTQSEGLLFTIGEMGFDNPSALVIGGGAVTTDTVTTGDRICIFDGDVSTLDWAREQGCDYEIFYDGWRADDIDKFGLIYRPVPPVLSQTFSISFLDWHLLVDGSSDCEYVPPVESNPLPFAPNCSMVYTDTISSGGVTQTVTTTHVISSNLLLNYSFEDAVGSRPEHWSPVVGGQESQVNPYYDNTAANARTGWSSIYNGDDFSLYQLLQLRSAGDYMAGFYATGDDIGIYLNGAFVAAGYGLTGTYTLVTGTNTTGGGGGWLHLGINQGSTTYADDAFLIPVDENGDLNCDPAFYPEPDDDDSDCVRYPDSAGCVVVPTGGAGDSCYFCAMPTHNYLYVSYWLAWLACIIRNLFSCSLRVWLLVVGNWSLGLLQVFLAFFVWVPATVQGAADWIAGEIVPAIMSAVTGVDNTGTTTSLWDVLLALIDLLQGIVASVSNLMLGIVNLISTVVGALRDAFAAAPHQLEFGPGDITEPDAGDLAATGQNDSKILYIVFLGLGVLDSVVFGNANLVPFLTVVLAGVGLMVALWTLRYWKNFVAF